VVVGAGGSRVGVVWEVGGVGWVGVVGMEGGVGDSPDFFLLINRRRKYEDKL